MKRKHRYYVCSDFHNKGSAACKANSIKAYESEDTVIKKIEHFSSNKKNEIIIQLSSIDSKVIQPELIEKLLKKFLSVYKKTDQEVLKT
jgi:site-specific DNA recombinase